MKNKKGNKNCFYIFIIFIKRSVRFTVQNQNTLKFFFHCVYLRNRNEMS